MSRTLTVLLALVAAAGVSRLDPSPAVAQDKKKDKRNKGAEPPPAAANEPADDLAKVLPVLDPGTHTRPILAMGFTKDGGKLVTVGLDYTVQVWSAATGDRLDVLRLPGYGHERGFNPGRWNAAAVSADGTRVALGGEAKALAVEEGPPADTRLVLLDIPTRTMRRVQIPGNGYVVEAVAFTPDGDALAVAIDRGRAKQSDLVVVGGLTQRLAAAGAGSIAPKDCPKVETPHPKGVVTAAFSPDGRKLLLGGRDHVVSVWDVPAGAAPRPALAKEVPTDGQTSGLAWAPDGRRFLRFGFDADGRKERGIEYREATGELVRRWPFADLGVISKKVGQVRTMAFLDPATVYLVANGFDDGDAYSPFTGTVTATLDVTTGAAVVLAGYPTEVSQPVGAVAPGGKRVAATTDGNTDIVIGRPAPGAAVVRAGARTPVPFHVGWAADPVAPGFAWGEQRGNVKKDVTAAGLTAGFDLRKVEPLGAVAAANYVPARRKLDGWELVTTAVGKTPVTTLVPPGAAEGVRIPGSSANRGRTLVPTPGSPPRVAFGQQYPNFGCATWLFTGDGTRLTRLLPDATTVHDVAAAPDGRYVVASTGTPRLVVHRTDGTAEPFLSFAQVNGEWVCWTAGGYYAASPGGEKLFGFAVNNGPNALVTFHPADRFAKHFRRPDVIRLAVEKGSVKAALEALSASAPEVESILPPVARLELVSRQPGKVKVRASAASPGKPVVALRVLLDGRPLANGAGVWTPAPGPAVAEFDLDVPPGTFELKALARNADGSDVSPPVTVRGPRAGPQPTLRRVCVGTDNYAATGLKLTTAVKDATDVFEALGRHCVGPDNRYGAATGELVTDGDAERVRNAITAVGRTARPGDLMVVFFAGHGVKQADGYYLLTRDSDPAAGLKGKALSGAELKTALAAVECPVLLALDACHSSAATADFVPATDDLTRSLTDVSVGVTVMSAAMAHERAGSTAANGHFTAGMVKGLAAGGGVRFDPDERVMYVHDLYSVVHSEVRRATGGRQTPFLNPPWTAPPLAVREVPGGG